MADAGPCSVDHLETFLLNVFDGRNEIGVGRDQDREVVSTLPGKRQQIGDESGIDAFLPGGSELLCARRAVCRFGTAGPATKLPWPDSPFA